MDLCYDTSLLSVGRKYRGGPCDWATNYGQITGITWDDPRSAFRGVHRGMNYSTLIGGLSIDPRVTDREHDDGQGSVHAPN